MSGSSKFWDRIAKRYARSPVADEAAYQRKLDITREYLRPDMEVLEFGCGTGSTAIAHAPFVKHIRATDISSNMLDIAREKAAANGALNVTFEQTSIDALAANDESYDVVLGLSILHLLDDRTDAIAKVYRLLKPGGVFVSSTACLEGAMVLMKPILTIGRFLGLLPLVRFFSIKELEDSITATGFTIDHLWQPGKGKAVFIVAKKPD